jgi:predicted permease
MNSFFRNQRQIWSDLKGKPGFVLTVVGTLGVTLGALICVLTLAYVILLKPLPYPEQDSLFKIEQVSYEEITNEEQRGFTYPALIHLYKKQSVFSNTAMITYGEDVLTYLPEQPKIQLGFVTPEWFTILDSKMLYGRYFESTESLGSNNPVAIISYKTWKNEFSSDIDIVGKKIDFTGVSYKIIGVLDKSNIEPQFDTGIDTNIWLPWDFNQMSWLKDRWGNSTNSLLLVGKIKKEYNAAQVEQIISPQVNDIWKEMLSDNENFRGWSVKMNLISLRNALTGDSKNTVLLLIACFLGLLIIASVNISNLLMSRTAEKRRSLSIRAALGATKHDLFLSIFSETGFLMFWSVVFALVIALLGFQLFQNYLVEFLPRVSELKFDYSTYAFAVLCVLGMSLIFAKLSTRMINYKELNLTLQSSGKGTGYQVSKRVRQVMIVSQVAVATSLIFVSINLLNYSVHIVNTPMGISTKNIISTELSYSSERWPAREERVPIVNNIKKELRLLPIVDSIVQAGSPLNRFSGWSLTDVKSNQQYRPEYKRVGAGYFKLLNQTILEGVVFSAVDVKDNNLVAVVNEEFARQIAPQGNVLGRHLSSGDRNYKIVGVVEGLMLPGANVVPSRAYIPMSLASTSLLIKLKDNQELSRKQYADILKKVDDMFSVYGFESLVEQRQKMLLIPLIIIASSMFLAALSALLAAVGLYGVISYGIQMRQFELGTRLTIGATRKKLYGLIIRDNMSPFVYGVMISFIIIFFGGSVYTEELDSFINSSLISISIVTLLFVCFISLFASLLPLRKFIKQPIIQIIKGTAQ